MANCCRNGKQVLCFWLSVKMMHHLHFTSDLGGLKAADPSLYGCCNPAMCYWCSNAGGEQHACASCVTRQCFVHPLGSTAPAWHCLYANWLPSACSQQLLPAAPVLLGLCFTPWLQKQQTGISGLPGIPAGVL